ncbi:MAG: metal-dependent transcriptional regulator [Anaerolineales bacterium]|nr:metal-dependent transcriptional regulator [Anaerolineales bacterium]MCA9930127.1 metal-dependent transcriptional regulator [Anaerolineales bacterium]
MPKINALETGSSQQRDNLNHQAIEDYMKTIFALSQEESPVSTSRIAEAREVKPASATSMIQRLAKLKLVDYAKHYGVTLTPSGKRLALEVIRHHRLLELYLIEALGFSWDEVHEQADVLEHVISEKLEERIAAALNHPEFDPHGDPIPTKDGTMPEVETQPLSMVPENTAVRIARVVDDSNSEMLRYLAGLGLMPGTAVTLLRVEPFDGPLTVEIGGEQKIIGFNVATSILVELVSDS